MSSTRCDGKGRPLLSLRDPSYPRLTRSLPDTEICIEQAIAVKTTNLRLLVAEAGWAVIRQFEEGCMVILNALLDVTEARYLNPRPWAQQTNTSLSCPFAIGRYQIIIRTGIL